MSWSAHFTCSAKVWACVHLTHLMPNQSTRVLVKTLRHRSNNAAIKRTVMGHFAPGELSGHAARVIWEEQMPFPWRLYSSCGGKGFSTLQNKMLIPALKWSLCALDTMNLKLQTGPLPFHSGKLFSGELIYNNHQFFNINTDVFVSHSTIKNGKKKYIWYDLHPLTVHDHGPVRQLSTLYFSNRSKWRS